MPLHKLSQKSFVSGQYDRTAQNQESVSGGGIVATGLSYAKNVLSSDRGELRKRLGTKFLKQLDGATVLIPFRMNDEDDVILTADANNIKGLKYVNGEVKTLLSVRPDADIAFPAANAWPNGTNKTGSVTSGDWTLSFSFYDPSGSSVIQRYPGWIINGGQAQGYSPASNKKQAPQTITITNTNTLSCMRNIKIWFWTSSSVGYQYQYWGNPVIEYSDDGSTWVGVQTDYRVGEYTPVSYTPPQDVTTPGGTIHIDADYKSKCAMTISQSNYTGKHNYWRIYFQTSSVSLSVFIDGVSFVDPGLQTVFQQTSPYTEDQLKNIKYSQDKNVMFISCEDVIPYRLVNNTGELTWGSFTPANTSTIWTTMGGYPAAVSTFQNRVWFGGFQNNPQTVIASKFDDYETFSGNTPAQKDDYLNLRCNQLKTKIRNLVGGQKVMYCFSEDGISNIDGGSAGLLATNENIEFILKNRMPAGSSTPGFKDDVMLYSSSDGTKLYGVDFDLLVNRFEVSDLAKYAKDVTKAKVTELHYVNNESKLVYGLTEEGIMFALLYEKGQYQGFFPLDFGGTVYDICPIKVGRDYKLLMVVFRDGNWYLEEKLDAGQYIDTSKPRMTAEEKKWATYDNLENNIAMDCYQTYDESFDAIVTLTKGLGDNILTGVETRGGVLDATGHYNTDGMCDFKKTSDDSVVQQLKVDTYLTTAFVPVQGGKTYKLSVSVDSDYYYTTRRVCSYDSHFNYIEDTLHDIRVLKSEALAGSYEFMLTVPENAAYVRVQYFNQDVPSLQDTTADIAISSVDLSNYIDTTVMFGTEGSKDFVICTVNSCELDDAQYNVGITIEAQRGTANSFTKVYPEFTQFAPNLPQVASVGVISEGRYFNATNPDDSALIYLPAPCHKVIYGVVYEAVAIIKMQSPYESLKNVAQVDVSVIDTTHLELGTAFSDTENLEKIDDSSYYDLTRITMNDIYRQVISDTPETTKSIILRSNKGVPFTVIAVDVYVSYSNLGGD